MKKRRLLLAAAVLPTLGLADVAEPQSISHPQLDTNQLGQVGIVGSFTGLSTIKYQGQNSVLRAVTENDNILTQSGSQPDAYLSAFLVDGTIEASCVLGDGKTAIIAGNFSRVRDSPASGIAKLDLSSGQVSTLANVTLSGGVHALLCNGSTVWVGGEFQLGGGQGVGLWNDELQTWQVPAFGGFQSGAKVNAIAQLGESIIFGGVFGSPVNGTADTTAGQGGSLIEQPEAPVPLGAANVVAQGSAGGSDANSILCPGSGRWTAEQGSKTSQLTVNMAREVQATSMRLYNLAGDGENGTKLFRLVTVPSNSIMNLTYVNQTTGQQQSCDAWCPLPPSSEQQYVDFDFVNEVGARNFTLSLLDYYGDYAGLSGFALKTNRVMITANNELNTPLECQNIKTSDGTVLNGNWLSIVDYMAARLTSQSEFASTSVRYYPELTQPANYSLLAYTPGCAASNTCSQRGQMNVSVYSAANEPPKTTLLWQTNLEDKYDPVYNGTLDPSDGFRPYVEITPVAGQQVPYEFAASQLGVVYLGAASVKIRNIFEFLPTNFSADHNTFAVGKTVINSIGSQLSENSEITGLLNISASSLMIAGNLSGTNFSNVLIYDNTKDGLKSLVQVRNAPEVRNVYGVNGSTYVVGYESVFNLTDGNGLANILNQSVSAIVPFSLDGNETIAFSSGSSYNATLPLWDSQNGKWYADESSSMGNVAVSGHLSQRLSYQSTMFYFGSILLQSGKASGGVSTDAQWNVKPQPFKFQSGNDDSAKAARGIGKRAAELPASNSINSGAYFNSTLSFVAGRFTARTSDNSTAKNILAVLGNESYSLPDGDFGNAPKFDSLTIVNTTLLLGGDFSGTVSSARVDGIAAYDIERRGFPSMQPPGLQDRSAGSSVSLVGRNGSSTVLVLGNFSGAGDVKCPGFCIYSGDDGKWRTPSQNSTLRAPSVSSGGAYITTDEAIIVGDFTLANGNKTNVLRYSFRNDSFSSLPASSSPNGSPLAVTTTQVNGSAVVIVALRDDQGSQHLIAWSQEAWHNLDSQFGAGTDIASIQILPSRSQQGNTRRDSDNSGNSTGAYLLGADQLLAVSGNVVLSSGGNASTALYDGQKWQPLFVATNEGSAGRVNTLYSELQQPIPEPYVYRLPPPRHFMSVGRVVGVSCAIAIGCILAMVILGLLWSRFSQRHTYEAPSVRVSDKNMMHAVPPDTVQGYYPR